MTLGRSQGFAVLSRHDDSALEGAHLRDGSGAFSPQARARAVSPCSQVASVNAAAELVDLGRDRSDCCQQCDHGSDDHDRRYENQAPDGVDVGPKTLYARLCVAAGNSKLFNDINGFGGRGVLSTALIILTKSRGGI